MLPKACIALASSALTLLVAGEQTVTLGDYEAYANGSYMAFIAPFNRGVLMPGKAYTESFSLTPSSFPGGSVMTWKWPSEPAIGVHDFNAVDFGNYFNTIVPIPIKSKAICDIKELTIIHKIALSGNLNGFDSIIDFFLTEKPGDHTTQSFEVEIFLHSPTYSVGYMTSVHSVGTIQVSDRLWAVGIDRSIAHPDILIMPLDYKDVLNSKIDIKAMIDNLVRLRLVNNKLYFNGLGFGTETQYGEGSMKITSLSINYD